MQIARNKRLWLVLSIAGVCVGIGIFLGWRADPYRYKGKSIRVLAVEAGAGETNAMAALRTLGSNALPALVVMLHTREGFWRSQAWSLAPKLPRRLRGPILKAVGPPRAVGLRTAGAKALALLGPEAAPATAELITALREKDRQVAWEAAKALSRIGKPALPELITCLTDKDPNVRWTAAYALGEMGAEAEAAVPDLMATLTDTNLDIRSSAAYSLGVIGFPSLLALSNIVDHGDAGARDLAVKNLLALQRAVRLMVKPLVKMAAAPEPASRKQAIEALGALRAGDDATVNVLIAGLKDPSSEVRVAAAKALSLVIWRAHVAVPGLIQCLQDESAEVRHWAAFTLGNVGSSGSPAIPELRKLAEQGEPAAEEALKKIGKSP